MGRRIVFSVSGQPATQGSTRAFMNRSTGKPYVTHQDGAKLKVWRESVGMAALAARRGSMMTGPVLVEVVFSLKRPQKPKNPDFPDTKGRHDIDKFLRAIFDAMSGVVYEDDAQVVRVVMEKRWAPKPGAEGATVAVEALDSGAPKA